MMISVTFQKCIGFKPIHSLADHLNIISELNFPTNSIILQQDSSKQLTFPQIIVSQTIPLKPYLSSSQLHQLLAANSPVNYLSYRRMYNRFVDDESNTRFLVSEKLKYPPGNFNKKVLTVAGILRFEQVNKKKLSFCHFSIVNFYIAANAVLKT